MLQAADLLDMRHDMSPERSASLSTPFPPSGSMLSFPGQVVVVHQLEQSELIIRVRARLPALFLPFFSVVAPTSSPVVILPLVVVC